MNLKNLFLMLTLFVLLGTTASAQQTWYVNNGPTGNDGRNGLAPTIPVPDDFVTGPKKTINNAMTAASAGDIIVVANTGVAYGPGTGEPGQLDVQKKLTFQSTGGTATISSLFEVNNGAAAPGDEVIFNSGAFSLSGGLRLTLGKLINSSGLITVSGGTITRSIALATVTGQLLYSGTVNFSYGATMTAGAEFPASGTINNLTTTAGVLTIKAGAVITMTGVFSTAGALNLGANTFTITNTGAPTHTFGGAVTNGTLAFSMGGGDVTLNGAFAIPTVTVTTSTTTPRTLAIAQPTSLTGTLTVSGLASVTTSAALVTIGTAGFTGNALTLSGTGTVTVSGAPTAIHGNVLLNSTGLTAAATAQINFGTAVTINGSVTNAATFTVANDAALAAGTTGLISFPDATIVITGNVVNSAVVGGTIGTATDIRNVGQIRFVNTNTNVTINGAIQNGSSTTIATSTQPAAFIGIGTITFGNYPTIAIIRADGGIVNSSNFSTVTGTNNVSNGQIILGGGARATGSTIGTTGNRVGAILNNSLGRANGDGNGNIVIGSGDGTASGFFGTSVSATGTAAGGYIIFGRENFTISGSISNSRTGTGIDVIDIGTAGLAGSTVTVSGTVTNSSSSNIRFNISTTGAVAITGSVNSSGSGTISWPNITSGTFSIGGLTVSAGTVSVPVTHSVAISINGTVSISGGAASLLGDGSAGITIVGNASFTGGTVTTTGRTGITLNSVSITLGGASSNTTFSTAATPFIIGNPTPTSLATVTIGGFNPVYPGNFIVFNTTGLAEAVRFTGGSLRISGLLRFQAGAVTVADQANLIAQSQTGTNDFQNDVGYITTDQGRITINPASANPQVTGAGDFGTIEFNAGANTVIIGNAITVKGTLYLTSGTVNNTGNNITFDNTTVLPTIVRNAGSFTAIPVFASNVNVTYIGVDKASGNELPAAPSTRLQNLTVATTNGAVVAGKGAVTIGANTIVNGTLTVNANQALSIDNTFALTMRGASIVLNGDITNTGTGVLIFGATAGTTVTGSGYLPNLQVAAGSNGNVINGATAIINQLLGTDNARGGAADFDPTTTSANGTVAYNGAGGTLTLALTGVAFNGSDLLSITTNAAGSNVLTLGSNIIMMGNLTHNAGTIDLVSYTLEHRGAAPNIVTDALFTGTGLLRFFQADATTNSAITLTTTATTGALIGVNVEIENADATAAEDDFILATGPVTISGTLTITDGELVLGQNLILTGSAFTITSLGTVSGASTLRLNAATPPLTMSFTGTPTIARLTISKDVNLAGGGTALTISTLFTHDGGVLNFGTRSLTFQTAFTRTAGTYSATTGYMIFDGAAAALAVLQGTDGFSIPNLRITNSGGNNVALSGLTAQGTITVTGAFDLANTTQTFTTSGKFAVASGATVNYTSGAISAAPAYAGSITLVALNVADGGAIPAFIWPTTAGLVTTFTVNSANAVDIVNLPGSRGVATTLNLTRGTLALGANTLTLASGASIFRTNLGSATVGAGGFAFPADNTTNVTYYANAAGITSGIELPAALNNLTISRSANVINQITTINSSAVVNGLFAIRNNVTVPATPPITLSVNGNVSISTDAFANATTPVATFTQSLVLGGSANTTITVPNVTPPLNIGAITINKAASTNTVTLAGGNLATGTVTFTMGDIVTGANTLFIPAPTINALQPPPTGTNAVSQGFTGAGANSHVIGNVAKTLINTGGIGGSTEARSVFPVGNGVVYRPAAISFNPAFGVPTNPNTTIVVNHADSNPGGAVGLPIKDGVAAGIDVSRYPTFYWNIYTTPGSVGPSTLFDLELTAGNFTDFDAPANVRIIRRHGAVGDLNNAWLLQGANNAYDNEVSSITGFTAINRGANAGLRSGGAVFTLGVKSNISIKTAIPKQWLVIPQGARVLSLVNTFQGNIGTLTFEAQSSNPTIVTAAIVGSSLTLTPLVIGEAVITVIAKDAANNDFYAYSFAADSRMTNVEGAEEIPTEFALSQNYPNPFNPTTNIKFALPKESGVTLRIFNILGEEVATLVNKVMPAGFHTVNFDASRLSSGMYIYRIEAGSFVQVKKMLLMK